MANPVPPDLTDAQAAALLAFYAEAGVDCLLEDAVIDRFAESAAARSNRPGPLAPPSETRQPAQPPAAADERAAPPQTSQAAAARPAIAVPDDAAIADARTLAREARSLDDLKARLDAYQDCALRFSAKSLVFADGNPQADIMFVGEAPGREEDIQGVPFVGRAGQMLDRMLAGIGRERHDVYITNMIFWRPPGNRTPTPHEVALCRPFTERHIELIDPKIVVFLGNVATKGMLETTKGILSLRGTWTDYQLGERVWPSLPTLHPAYLLRNPAHKKLAWRDFLSLRARADALSE